MAMNLYGITILDGQADSSPAGKTELVAFRDLAAVVEPGEYIGVAPTGSALERYERVVEAVFTQRAVVPAPPGTVFRSRETLVRWMELHYVALSDALSFVEDRAVARIHICRATSPREERERTADLAAAAAESFRVLRRRAVLAIPLKTGHIKGIVLSSSFLVEKELWKEFTSAVNEEQGSNHALELQMTGPWPPYDFVRMQFGT
jgi:hypothetical protein